MDRGLPLILIDRDSRRRAQISHSLSAQGIHVEPFETVAELAQGWPRSGIVLVHDEPGAVRAVITEMAREAEWFPIVAFGENPSAAQIVSATLEGAIEYLAWPYTSEELSQSLDRALARSDGLGNARVREAMARGRIGRLTDREREVLDCVASGLSNRMIGEKLAISPRTVEIHRANMLNKLGAQHTSQAIRIAIEAELVR